jgi:hypothetical protein
MQELVSLCVVSISNFITANGYKIGQCIPACDILDWRVHLPVCLAR